MSFFQVHNIERILVYKLFPEGMITQKYIVKIAN